MKVSSERYIFPPRAKSAVPPAETDYLRAMNFVAQFKYNDTHILIKYLPGWDQGNIQLWDRHGDRLRSYSPQEELMAQLIFVGKALGLDTDNWSLLDGGLMDKKHPGLKDVIVLWDILVVNGDHLLNTTYQSRHAMLTKPFGDESWMYTNHMKPDAHPPVDFGVKCTDSILIPRSYSEGWDKLWELVHLVNAPFCKDGNISPLLEGLVLKQPSGTLEPGYKMSNNADWLIRSRVTTGRHKY